jgi:hypothetical protein
MDYQDDDRELAGLADELPPAPAAVLEQLQRLRRLHDQLADLMQPPIAPAPAGGTLRPAAPGSIRRDLTVPSVLFLAGSSQSVGKVTGRADCL